MSASVFATITSFQKILFRKDQITFFGIIDVAFFKKLIIYFFHQV